MSKLQKKPTAHKRGHPTLQNVNLKKKFLLLWVIFAHLDPDPEYGSNPDPDPKPWFPPCVFDLPADYCLSGPRIIPDLVPAKTLAAEAVQTAAAAVASEAVQTTATAVAMPPETGGEAVVVNAPAFRIPCEARAAASIWLCLRCGSQVLAILSV
jgi:hypothetical protein